MVRSLPTGWKHFAIFSTSHKAKFYWNRCNYNKICTYFVTFFCIVFFLCFQDIVLYLLENGADIDMFNNHNNTPFFLATESLQKEICQVKSDLIYQAAADWLTDWLTDRQTDWLTDWLTDWQTDCLTDWQTDWLTDWLTVWLADWQTDWLTDWLTVQPAVWLNYWPNDWLTEWLTVWRDDCLYGSWSTCLITGWLVCLLINWLTVWVIDGLF